MASDDTSNLRPPDEQPSVATSSQPKKKKKNSVATSSQPKKKKKTLAESAMEDIDWDEDEEPGQVDTAITAENSTQAPSSQQKASNPSQTTRSQTEAPSETSTHRWGDEETPAEIAAGFSQAPRSQEVNPNTGATSTAQTDAATPKEVPASVPTVSPTPVDDAAPPTGSTSNTNVVPPVAADTTPNTGATQQKAPQSNAPRTGADDEVDDEGFQRVPLSRDPVIAQWVADGRKLCTIEIEFNGKSHGRCDGWHPEVRHNHAQALVGLYIRQEIERFKINHMGVGPTKQELEVIKDEQYALVGLSRLSIAEQRQLPFMQQSGRATAGPSGRSAQRSAAHTRAERAGQSTARPAQPATAGPSTARPAQAQAQAQAQTPQAGAQAQAQAQTPNLSANAAGKRPDRPADTAAGTGQNPPKRNKWVYDCSNCNKRHAGTCRKCRVCGAYHKEQDCLDRLAYENAIPQQQAQAAAYQQPAQSAAYPFTFQMPQLQQQPTLAASVFPRTQGSRFDNLSMHDMMSLMSQSRAHEQQFMRSYLESTVSSTMSFPTAFAQQAPAQPVQPTGPAAQAAPPPPPTGPAAQRMPPTGPRAQRAPAGQAPAQAGPAQDLPQTAAEAETARQWQEYAARNRQPRR